ncbi:MAG: Mov34/MPN/PAD-1 family protein [Tepidisphaeraceae bacterium]
MSRAMVANLGPPVDQDLSSIRTGEWPDRDFPLVPRDRATRRSVIIKQSVLNDVYDHGRGAPEIEVCGVLVGNVYQDASGPFVFIEAGIRGNFSAGRAAQVTFTAKTWTHIQDVMERQYADMRILGWYHTHPGHGIFLSDMDLFIHKNFFSLPWHLAFVFDPQHQEEGLFAWRGGNLAIESFVVQPDAIATPLKVARHVTEATPQGASRARSLAVPTARPAADGADDTADVLVAPARPSAAAAEVADVSLRIQTLERKQRWLTAALALIVLLAVAWPIALAALTVLRAPQDLLPSWLAPKPAATPEEINVGETNAARALAGDRNAARLAAPQPAPPQPVTPRHVLSAASSAPSSRPSGDAARAAAAEQR